MLVRPAAIVMYLSDSSFSWVFAPNANIPPGDRQANFVKIRVSFFLERGISLNGGIKEVCFKTYQRNTPDGPFYVRACRILNPTRRAACPVMS